MKEKRRVLVVSMAVALGIGLSACSVSVGQEDVESLVPTVSLEDGTEAADAPPVGESPDPEDVPEDDTDYSVDAGDDLKEYDYPDDPLPADSTVATLCSLSQEYLSQMRTVQSGVPVVDDMLRTNLVGLADLLAEWDTLVPHFPEYADDIGRANAVERLWDMAVLSEENGDTSAAAAHMADAEELLGELPESAGPDCH